MPEDPASLPSREEALALLHEWVSEEPLRRHCLAVEAAMRDQARRRGAEEQLWGLAGLLHDLDYERHPDLETGHPRYAMAELERLGYPPELVRAIASHADYMGVSRDTEMERALAAVDELSGFVLACAYVRPEGLTGMTAEVGAQEAQAAELRRGCQPRGRRRGRRAGARRRAR